jgi:hypothetical protein
MLPSLQRPLDAAPSGIKETGFAGLCHHTHTRPGGCGCRVAIGLLSQRPAVLILVGWIRLGLNATRQFDPERISDTCPAPTSRTIRTGVLRGGGNAYLY